MGHSSEAICIKNIQWFFLVLQWQYLEYKVWENNKCLVEGHVMPQMKQFKNTSEGLVIPSEEKYQPCDVWQINLWSCKKYAFSLEGQCYNKEVSLQMFNFKVYMKLRKVENCWYGTFNSALKKNMDLQQKHLKQVKMYFFLFLFHRLFHLVWFPLQMSLFHQVISRVNAL